MSDHAEISGSEQSFTALNSLARSVVGSLNSKDICRALVEMVSATLPSDGVWVSAINLASGAVGRVHATGKGEKSARGPERPYTGSIEQMVADGGGSIIVNSETINQFSMTDRHVAALKRSGAKCMLLTPVFASDDLFGVIGVNSSNVDTFQPGHVKILESATAEVRSALGAALSHGRLARQIEISEIISTIIRSANSADGIEDLVAAVATGLREAMPLERLDLLLTRDRDIADISSHEWGMPAADWRSKLVSTGGDGLLAYVLSSRKSWSASDVTDRETLNRFPALETIGREGIRSMLAAPMFLDGRPAGALICSTSSENAYHADHRGIVESVADHISGAAVIHMIREQTANEAEELAVIAEIGRTLSASVDTGQAFLAFVNLVRRLIPFDRVVVSSFDSDHDILTDIYVAGAPLPSFSEGGAAEGSKTMGANMFAERKTIRWDEEELREASQKYASAREALEVGLRSLMSVPLIWQNEVVGTLNFRSRMPSAYGSREQATAERVSAQIAGGIATSRLYKQLELESELRKSLAAISLAAGKDLDLNSVFERAADEIARIIEYDRISVALIDQRSGMLKLRYFRGIEIAERSLGSEIRMDPRINRWRLTFQKNASEGSFYGTEAELRSKDKSAVIWRPGVGSIIQSRLEVPLGTEGSGTIGYFGISSKTADKYTLDDLGFLERVAIQITPAIQNAITHQQAVELGEERNRADDMQAQAEELERLNQIKSQFLSNITHELKTPLTSIMAFSDILSRNKKGNLDEKQMKQVDVVRRNATHLQGLISDLVDVSRIENGRLVLIEREFDLSELLREIGDNLQPQFDDRKQSVIYELPEQPVILIADRDRIAQVIMNLLSNASKYSDPETKITVTASDDSNWCSFSISDQGIGISEHDRTHLFAAFYRADNSITREHGGTGLGLSIAKSMVDLHGGQIEVESEPGKGSMFTVGLPKRLELKDAG